MKPIPAGNLILTVNGGSSSIKFAIFDVQKFPERVASGEMKRIGPTDYPGAAQNLFSWIEDHCDRASIKAIGHRVVHGGTKYSNPTRIDSEMLQQLRYIISFDPEHLPQEIQLTEIFFKAFPEIPQVACFDTAFHKTLPRVAQMLAIPRRLEGLGVKRYGFHGLSYDYLMEELRASSNSTLANGKVILAHLGSGASLAAVLGGKSVDTSMGFTPAAGIPMGTRSGDLDPGLAMYLQNAEGLDVRGFNEMIFFQSGLLGMSETSSDMHDLLELEHQDVRAAEAISLFCYQVKKWIGSFAAVLGGLDTLVFSGGIGENAPQVRARVCKGLEFLGVELDLKKNDLNEGVISSSRSELSRVLVRVIKTDEEKMIAKQVCSTLGWNP